MKTFFFVSLLLLSTLIAPAQSTNASAARQPSTNAPVLFQSDPLGVQLYRAIQPSAIEPLQPRPNEIQFGKVTASGIAIEGAKTKQPLKLINPFSPPANSSPEDNVVRNPFNGKVDGLKVFAIHF
jgi:hypothetical protein